MTNIDSQIAQVVMMADNHFFKKKITLPWYLNRFHPSIKEMEVKTIYGR